jgi:hypothetical protein
MFCIFHIHVQQSFLSFIFGDNLINDFVQLFCIDTFNHDRITSCKISTGALCPNVIGIVGVAMGLGEKGGKGTG